MLQEQGLLRLASADGSDQRAEDQSPICNRSSRFYIGLIAKETGAVLGCSPKLGLSSTRSTDVAFCQAVVPAAPSSAALFSLR